MEEKLSWRARLAKSNINILNIDRLDNDRAFDVFFEFMYHPKPGQTKWCKTVLTVLGQEVELGEGEWERLQVTGDDIVKELQSEVLALRKELEA